MEFESDENTMNIMVATDIHLGYNEKDPIRGEDSFIAFEEILQHAERCKVDFILLGGDLFHDARPSTKCLHRCISLLRRYCMGDREVQIEFLSDQNVNFKHQINPHVNYEDPNQNISIPVFSIHGNHDDPSGPARLSVLDILADTGLINYFGKWSDLTEVTIYPLLIRKGNTKLALYGLSHIRDERLSRLFINGQVKMLRPKGDYFNLMVLHQNRVDRGPKNFIPEEVLPNFLDLVIWGHEHDCLVFDELQTNTGIRILQPGSSVATSLSFGEARPKHCVLLQIRDESYKINNILLKTVRPFVFDNVSVSKDVEGINIQEKVQKDVNKKVEKMLQDAKQQLHDDEPRQPKLPLIRLVYNIFEESQQFNAIKIGQQYSGIVANPDDMLLVKFRRKTVKRDNTGDFGAEDDEITGEGVQEGQLFCDQVESLLEQYMETQKKKPMNILSVKAMCEATIRFLEHNDESAFEHVINHQMEKTKKKLLEMDLDLSKKTIDVDLDIALEELRMERMAKNDEISEINKMLNDPNRKIKQVDNNDDQIEIDASDDDDVSTGTIDTVSTSRGRGRGESRGARRNRARRSRAR